MRFFLQRDILFKDMRGWFLEQTKRLVREVEDWSARECGRKRPRTASRRRRFQVCPGRDSRTASFDPYSPEIPASPIKTTDRDPAGLHEPFGSCEITASSAVSRAPEGTDDPQRPKNPPLSAGGSGRVNSRTYEDRRVMMSAEFEHLEV